ncbi:hypothetical protein O9929_25045 [Vibrio lentus]|nr:hypothetical protein [Vibrio lentus]
MGFITIYDIPAGLAFSHGSWLMVNMLVDLADVPNLAITGGYDGVDPFELTIEPSAEDRQQPSGKFSQTPVSVEFVAEGDSTITATDGNDLLRLAVRKVQMILCLNHIQGFEQLLGHQVAM